MRLFFPLLFSILIFSCSSKQEAHFEGDIITYGGTSAGITAAVQAKKISS
ncbi:hypothetical protein [Algoriphagus alkaliphilus]|nr:hypothetical protein [Algoriphagus alkaliphilus]